MRGFPFFPRSNLLTGIAIYNIAVPQPARSPKPSVAIWMIGSPSRREGTASATAGFRLSLGCTLAGGGSQLRYFRFFPICTPHNSTFIWTSLSFVT